MLTTYLRQPATAVEEGTAAPDDVPVIVSLVHAAYPEHGDTLVPSSGAHAEDAHSPQARLARGGAALACLETTALGTHAGFREPTYYTLQKWVVG